MKIDLAGYFRSSGKLFAVGGAFLTVCLIAGLFVPGEMRERLLDALGKHYANIEFSFFGIFLNNLLVATVMTLGGFLLGFPTIIAAGTNFFVIGVALSYAISKGGTVYFLLSILPHGVVEIPAIFLSFVSGLGIAAALMRQRTFYGESSEADWIKHALLAFGLLVVPALALAALLEVTVTPAVLKLAGALP